MTTTAAAATASSCQEARSFADRHIGPSHADVEFMLGRLDLSSVDELIEKTVPQSIRESGALTGLEEGLSEAAMLDVLAEIGSKNRILTSLIGQGYYGTYLPPVIQRNVLENPAWYTAYTPYQPEISQGRLEALLNFQTMVCDLTGLPAANASLLDEATAAAEAMALAARSATSNAQKFFVDRACHPQTINVLRTRAEPLGWTLVIGDPESDLCAHDVFGALFQYPGSDGEVRDFRAPIAALHEAGAIAAMAADPLALALLVPPGELGADIAIGSMQRFGVPMGFGGPHAAYMAVRDGLQRGLPGRLVGVSADTAGRTCYRLALQTREQHIRREKATSNICTAQVLLAVIAGMYAVYHGPQGLAAMAKRVHLLTSLLKAGLQKLGLDVVTEGFFDTIVVRVDDADLVARRALTLGVNLRRIDDQHLGISLDETSDKKVVCKVWVAFAQECDGPEMVGLPVNNAIPHFAQRVGPLLDHPVFHRYRSETEMLRYIRRLADRDLALDRTMIPLGSCTMKLNGTAEMMPVTWPCFSDLHPFAPADQAEGYRQMLDDLAARLCVISGYDAVSLQPNSGAQGEYTGLLAIRRYHLSRGDGHRNVCLIPSSAHGTNPASAQMAGMRVVVVNCDAAGNVDTSDLRAKAALHARDLAAIMITYPSTHGVFEEAIVEICDIVHAAGGQVYLDGANLNAQVGLARPGRYGADVSHFNLHKTFCIPHGGGGPGMGPIGVRAHLAPFLPGHPLEEGAGAVSAAPFGSALVLPIAYGYMLLMGKDGLKNASEVAILNANYIAWRLQPHYPILYRGANGFVAHECIVDLRPVKAATGVTVDDVAKRLIDFGFHAPTVSFPVPGTLMIEPTESESLAELDRFCDAMIAIRKEIGAIESGAIPLERSPLRMAPHTMSDLVAEAWGRPYTRKQGCTPGGLIDKYWPPVNRVDHVHGDRNLFCTCPPIVETA